MLEMVFIYFKIRRKMVRHNLFIILLFLNIITPQQIAEIYEDLESLENFGKKRDHYIAPYTGDSQNLEYKASLYSEQQKEFQEKIQNLTSEYAIKKKQEWEEDQKIKKQEENRKNIMSDERKRAQKEKDKVLRNKRYWQ